MEILLGQMVIGITGNGKMVKVTVTELKYGKMEENILVHLKKINYMEKEPCIILMEKNM